MPAPIRLALPDLVSNSYFPAIAAVELSLFRKHGLDVELEMIYPAPACYDALRDGAVDLVAGSAHLPLLAFPRWEGASLVCALSQGMYWFLVLRDGLAQQVLAQLDEQRANLEVLSGLRIVAAPGVDLGLQQLLVAADVDATAADIQIIRLPGGVAKGESFGVAAARAMIAGHIDGFWANGMGTEVAVQSGAGQVVLDIRRGDGPAQAFNYTMASIAASQKLIDSEPEVASAAVRAIVRAQEMLRADTGLATQVAAKLFPERETALIERLITRDLPYYDASISPEFVAGMNRFGREIGILEGDPAYEDVVATQFTPLWTPQENG